MALPPKHAGLSSSSEALQQSTPVFATSGNGNGSAARIPPAIVSRPFAPYIQPNEQTLSYSGCRSAVGPLPSLFLEQSQPVVRPTPPPPSHCHIPQQLRIRYLSHIPYTAVPYGSQHLDLTQYQPVPTVRHVNLLEEHTLQQASWLYHDQLLLEQQHRQRLLEQQHQPQYSSGPPLASAESTPQMVFPPYQQPAYFGTLQSPESMYRVQDFAGTSSRIWMNPTLFGVGASTDHLTAHEDQPVLYSTAETASPRPVPFDFTPKFRGEAQNVQYHHPTAQEALLSDKAEPIGRISKDSELSPPISVSSSRLRSEAAEFVPYSSRRQHSPQQHHLLSLKGSQWRFQKPASSSRSKFSETSDVRLFRTKQLLRNYALQALAPYAEQGMAIDDVMSNVTRIPAVCFNEQKLEEKDGYQVLHKPQSPAVRGQEALSRVCLALEQSLRRRNRAASIFSDYKYKENYLRNAPPEVLEVLPCPEDEGSHDILVVGLDIGIVCIQVTCIESTTNVGTVKKQVRDTLKQLQKDVKVVKHILKDLALPDRCIHMIMALPNITREQLRQKLDGSFLKVLVNALGTTDNLDGLLTLDCLPGIGQRHWSSEKSRDQLQAWFSRLYDRQAILTIDDYIQIFARYSCGWSMTEVWSVTKPRVVIRSWAHAVAETFRRYHVPVLTSEQADLLQWQQPYVLIAGDTGCAVSCLLKVKAMLELKQGSDVLVFVPAQFTGLREEYQQLAKFLQSGQYLPRVYYFWMSDELVSETSVRLTTSQGERKTLNSFKGKERTFALFDHVQSGRAVSTLIKEVTEIITSVWVVPDVTSRRQLSLPDGKYVPVQFSSMVRIPTAIQALVKLGLQLRSSRTDSPMTSTQDCPQLYLSMPRRDIMEVSSYAGLPTDGPSPVFIWHKVPKLTSDSGILHCVRCMTRLRIYLRMLVGEFVPRTNSSERKDKGETTTPTKESQQFSGESCRETKETQVTNEEESSIDEKNLETNSGNVPQTLKCADVAIFVDLKEDIVTIMKMLDLDNVEKVVYSLTDLPVLTGTEKALVVYVGCLNHATGTIVHAMASKLCDVMALCQGQLILALEPLSATDQDPSQLLQLSGRDPQLDSYLLDFDIMLQEAQRQHSQD